MEIKKGINRGATFGSRACSRVMKISTKTFVAAAAIGFVCAIISDNTRSNKKGGKQ